MQTLLSPKAVRKQKLLSTPLFTKKTAAIHENTILEFPHNLQQSNMQKQLFPGFPSTNDKLVSDIRNLCHEYSQKPQHLNRFGQES